MPQLCPVPARPWDCRVPGSTGQDTEGILTSNMSSWVVVTMVSTLVNIPQMVIKTHNFERELKFPSMAGK